MGGVPAFRLEDARGRRYVVCAAMGHLYGISDTVKDRRVYPVLDLEWFPLGATQRQGRPARSRAGSEPSGASLKEADGFVNACDFDIEGETIGYNILRYACGGREASALRARFSALTKEEVVEAFSDDRLGSTDGLAKAGRLRHVIDFIWGVNLSRALSESLRTGYSFRTVSMGRVQGPTLNFVVEKEVDARTFVPTPYWTVRGSFRRGRRGVRGQVLLVADGADEARGRGGQGRLRGAGGGRHLSSRGGRSTSGLPLLSTSRTFRRRHTGSSATLRARRCRSRKGCTWVR